MDEAESPADAGRCAGPKPVRQRRRQGGRGHVVKVRLDEMEAAELARRAAAAGVSQPRFLVESALRGAQTVPERRALVRAFQVARVSVAGAARNLNQLARWANTEQRLPAESELREAEARMVELGDAMAAAAERLDS